MCIRDSCRPRIEMARPRSCSSTTTGSPLVCRVLLSSGEAGLQAGGVPGRSKRQQNERLWAGTRAPQRPLFGNQAARVLLSGPEGGPQRAGGFVSCCEPGHSEHGGAQTVSQTVEPWISCSPSVRSACASTRARVAERKGIAERQHGQAKCTTCRSRFICKYPTAW